jgi:hypothetical protein
MIKKIKLNKTYKGEEAHPAVKRLVEMGFSEDKCRHALLNHKGMYVYINEYKYEFINTLVYIYSYIHFFHV